jgi:hypothetical protein
MLHVGGISMGRGTVEKADQPIRIRITKDQEERMHRARAKGAHKGIDMQNFTLVLLEMGLQEYERLEKIRAREEDVPIPEPSRPERDGDSRKAQAR